MKIIADSDDEETAKKEETKIYASRDKWFARSQTLGMFHLNKTLMEYKMKPTSEKLFENIEEKKDESDNSVSSDSSDNS